MTVQALQRALLSAARFCEVLLQQLRGAQVTQRLCEANYSLMQTLLFVPTRSYDLCIAAVFRLQGIWVVEQHQLCQRSALSRLS